jgi:hypothetical protein
VGATAAPQQGKVSEVFGSTLSRVVRRPGWALLGITYAAWVIGVAVLAATLLVAAEAVFGTLHVHRIVNTHCIERVHRAAGQGDTFKLRPNCELWRIHPGVGKPLVTGVAGAIVLIIVGTALWLVVSRAADRRFGSLRVWPLIPDGGTVLRTIGRVIGWGFLVWLIAIGVVGVIAIAFAILVGVGGVIGVLLGLAGLVYLGIWWLVPYIVRLQMAFTRMVIDDTRFPECWNLIRPRLGQAWAFVGLMTLLAIGFGLIGSVLRAAGTGGQVLSILVNPVGSTVELAITVAVMRFLAGELGTDEPVEPGSPPLYGPGADPTAPA